MNKPAAYVFGYVFNYTDHLGNVRLSYAQNSITKKVEIFEENNYYPFGLKHQGYNTLNLQLGYKYKYNGKELQEELELNVYDYGARNYDAAIGRWMNIDRWRNKGVDGHHIITQWITPIAQICATIARKCFPCSQSKSHKPIQPR